MSSSELTLDLLYGFLHEKGGKVKNRDAVRHFRSYLTDPVYKEDNRLRFKTFVNQIAHTRMEGDEKMLVLKSKYQNVPYTPPSPLASPLSPGPVYSPQCDPRNSLGIPTSPTFNAMLALSPPSVRQPPPYRPPPPPVYVSSSSLDTLSLGSMTSLNDSIGTPQAPPRRKDSVKRRSMAEDSTHPRRVLGEPQATEAGGGDQQAVSVKERTQKFNRMASIEDELSPRQPKSAEKKMNTSRGGATEDERDLAELPIEPKRCTEWYVTASKGDCQELLRLANQEPRLANRKDPFTAYTVLHWGAKYGNAEIIKIFAGRYHVDVNGKTNGGYTPLHISAQFGHKEVFKLLIEVYKADPNIRDFSGRTADYYLMAKQREKHNSGHHVTLRSEYPSKSRPLRHGSKTKSKSFRNKHISAPIASKTAAAAPVGTAPAVAQ